MNEFEIQVDKESEGIRLDTFLKNSFPDISRASIQKAIRGGSCKIDDKITIQPSAKIRMNLNRLKKMSKFYGRTKPWPFATSLPEFLFIHAHQLRKIHISSSFWHIFLNLPFRED